MGRYDRTAMRTGYRPPSGGHVRDVEELEDLLELTRDADPLARRVAAKRLCPCHVRSDVPEVWDRLFEMISDPDPGVRRDVVHALGDGSPRERAHQVAGALERLYNDPDRGVRRLVRKVLAAYRRTGRVNVL